MTDEQQQPVEEARQGVGWRASRLVRKPVVNVRGVTHIGRVTDVVFDPEDSRLAGLLIDPASEETGLGALARRAFSAGGLEYIPVEHVVALNGDVVTVDVDPGQQQQRVGDLPRLSSVRDLLLITLHGRGLGRLVDLLLDESGAIVSGYLINPNRKSARALPRPGAVEAADAAQDQDAAATVDREPGAPEPLPGHLRVIPASPRVRFGRALIIVIDQVEPVVGREVRIKALDGATRTLGRPLSDPTAWQRMGAPMPAAHRDGPDGGNGVDGRVSH